MQQLGIKIDLAHSKLTTDKVEIPLLFKPNYISKQYTILPRSKLLAEVPVDVQNGEVYLKPAILHGNLLIPEGIYNSREYYATVEVVNYSNQQHTFVIEHPLKGERFENYHSEINEQKMYDHMSTDSKSITQLIRTEHLNQEEKRAIEKLCSKYEGIFQKENKKLSFTNVIKHEINTEDEKPTFTKSYRYPHIHKQEVEEQIMKMLDQGIIRPSYSPWSSPIWIVPKKVDASGKAKWRLVIDYRKLNEKTISDRYPLPNITDILDKLGKCIYFTTLDLASGFHQIEVDPKDIQKTAFSVNFGHYEYVRMPFGLKNAPSTFQRVMDNVLGELQGKICLCYMDDIIIFSTSLQEHIESLTRVFNKLQTANLKVQLDKSEFLHKEIAFLGHLVTSDGVKPNPDKIRAIQNFPVPRTEKQIKSFLGLMGYYRKFIPNFANATKPMTECLRKDKKIILDEQYVKCFEHCKTLLCSQPILQYPDFDKPFVVTTDASNVAIGAVLSQGQIGKDLPICYASRTLSKSEQNYSTIEKELLAIVWATKYFRPYLFGKSFTIVTDHKPLTWLFSLKEPNSKLVRWRLKLEEFDYSIQYKKGIQNSNADALSRIEPEIIPSNAPIKKIEINNSNSSTSSNATLLSTLELPIPITKSPINHFEQQLILHISDTLVSPIIKRDILFEKKKRITAHLLNKPGVQTQLQGIMRELSSTKKITCIFTSDENYPLVQRAYRKIYRPHNRVTKPKATFVRSMIFLHDILDPDQQTEQIRLQHEQQDHRGIIENYDHIRKDYYFPKMKEQITEYINKCSTCQKTKYDRQPPQIQMELTETPSKPMEIIHIDIFQMQSQIYLTLIDKFSKFAAAYTITDKLEKTILGKIINFCSLHGIPGKIIVDNEKSFNSRLFKEFTNKHGIQLHTTTPYNSSGNSPVERLHSTLKELFSIIHNKEPTRSMEDVMSQAILSYNNSIHSLTKLTPFQLLTGHYVNKRLNFVNEIDYLKQHVNAYEQLCNNIYTLSLGKKKALIDKINEKRKPSPTIKTGQIIYAKKLLRNKIKPKFQKLTVTKDNKITLSTPIGNIHKAKIKRLFQINNDTRTDHQPGSPANQ